jgi:hypothetical protein
MFETNPFTKRKERRAGRHSANLFTQRLFNAAACDAYEDEHFENFVLAEQEQAYSEHDEIWEDEYDRVEQAYADADEGIDYEWLEERYKYGYDYY